MWPSQYDPQPQQPQALAALMEGLLATNGRSAQYSLLQVLPGNSRALTLCSVSSTLPGNLCCSCLHLKQGWTHGPVKLPSSWSA